VDKHGSVFRQYTNEANNKNVWINIARLGYQHYGAIIKVSWRKAGPRVR